MKVSIICTNYNKGDWVREAMDSFLNQKTNFDFEIIIIDDASTDHSYELIQEYQNKFPEKVRTFRNEVNLGITRTWKKFAKKLRDSTSQDVIVMILDGPIKTSKAS